MTMLKVGIASYDEMKGLTLAIAREERKLAPEETRVWLLRRSLLPGCFGAESGIAEGNCGEGAEVAEGAG